jgi:S-adenosylmethionine:tRNA ribosyltransferase-isomerase
VNLTAFDYHLPEELIAQHPVEPRDAARLMVVHRKTGRIEHRSFRDILGYLSPGDALVVNRTRVMPARLHGVRVETGGKVEVVLIREAAPGLWEALLRPGGRLAAGTRLALEAGAFEATVANAPGDDPRYVRFAEGVDVRSALFRSGRMPLPPYIRRDPVPADRDRYQTVYAAEPGAIAAPTAGLHFTEDLLDRIRKHGVAVVSLLLHVGPGTFLPVRTETVEAHRMEPEYYRVEAEAVRRIVSRRRKGRLVAVGTTTVRTLETVAAGAMGEADDLPVRDYEGWTSCYIYPPYRFRLVDALVTNFHLPRSTLLMLVCAFAGRELTLRAYEEAVRERYRFYSYGDAMLVV